MCQFCIEGKFQHSKRYGQYVAQWNADTTQLLHIRIWNQTFRILNSAGRQDSSSSPHGISMSKQNSKWFLFNRTIKFQAKIKVNDILTFAKCIILMEHHQIATK